MTTLTFVLLVALATALFNINETVKLQKEWRKIRELDLRRIDMYKDITLENKQIIADLRRKIDSLGLECKELDLREIKEIITKLEMK